MQGASPQRESRRSVRTGDEVRGTERERPTLSVLVPTLEEARWIGPCLQSVRASLCYGSVSAEVIVCDGGSDDETLAVAEGIEGVRTMRMDRAQRARQLNEAAAAARGRHYVFLHADTVVPPNWARRIETTLREGAVGGWWNVEILPESASLSFPRRLGLAAIAWGINRRTGLFQTATGDQSIFVRSEVFDAIGGFPASPVMEGARLAREIRARGRVVRLDGPIRISGRRWERGGLLATTLRMYAIRAGFHAGIDVDRLAAFWEGRS